MRISDWSSDVCSSDLARRRSRPGLVENGAVLVELGDFPYVGLCLRAVAGAVECKQQQAERIHVAARPLPGVAERLVGGKGPQRIGFQVVAQLRAVRSEEHTSELQSLMRISYAVFCLK